MNATALSKDTILQVEHLSMKFGGLVAIGDLSFQAKRGEITALIGPNGAGKTTVFNCITGFYTGPASCASAPDPAACTGTAGHIGAADSRCRASGRSGDAARVGRSALQTRLPDAGHRPYGRRASDGRHLEQASGQGHFFCGE